MERSVSVQITGSQITVTKADSFPLPPVEDYVGAARFVSKFDLLKGRCQVLLTRWALFSKGGIMA